MLRDGSLFFPVTPFDDRLQLVPGALRDHVLDHAEYPIGAAFAACGTGEFHSLTATEVGEVVRTVRQQLRSDVPVFGPAGGPLGHALECVRHLVDAGADGILVMAPAVPAYSPAGHARYLEQILTASALPCLIYHRPESRLLPETVRHLLGVSQFAGFKDGFGDLAEAQVLLSLGRAHRGDAFVVLNGLSLAECREREYAVIGIPRYSSAAFTMDGAVGDAYLRARTAGDSEVCSRLLAEFFGPLARLRDRSAGYAVSMVKNAVRLRGREVGPVRPPLTELTDEHQAELRRILDRGRAAAGVA